MHPPEKMKGRPKRRKCRKRSSRSKPNRREDLKRAGGALTNERCAGTKLRLGRTPPPEKPPLNRGDAGAKCLGAGAELKCDEPPKCDEPEDARPPAPRICACASGRAVIVPSATMVRSHRITSF